MVVPKKNGKFALIDFWTLNSTNKKGYGSFMVVALSLQKSIDANSQFKGTKLPFFVLSIIKFLV
jgi:hypothetical protein